MYLSIIIPAWNEAGKIVADIQGIDNYFTDLKKPVELIIVDDGSTDKTSQLAESTTISDHLTRKVISYSPHRGKGYAVRMGIEKSVGEVVMFMDSGGNVPLIFIEPAIELIENKQCDVVLGSRYLPTSVIRKKLVWYRRITSTLFKRLVKWYLKLPATISDTQCGFKIFRGDQARIIFDQNKSDGFTFDLEMILQAVKQKYKICEIPIEWTCDRDSRLSVIHSLFSIFIDLKMLKKRYL